MTDSTCTKCEKDTIFIFRLSIFESDYCGFCMRERIYELEMEKKEIQDELSRTKEMVQTMKQIPVIRNTVTVKRAEQIKEHLIRELSRGTYNRELWDVWMQTFKENGYDKIVDVLRRKMIAEDRRRNEKERED